MCNLPPVLPHWGEPRNGGVSPAAVMLLIRWPPQSLAPLASVMRRQDLHYNECSRERPPSHHSKPEQAGRQREGRTLGGGPFPFSPIVCDQALAQPQFSENVHHDFHGGLVCHSERAEVEKAPQLEHGGGAGWQRRAVVREINN